MDPGFSVVIAAHSMERLGQIEMCVDSVLKGTRKPDEIFVVVDNNKRLAGELTGRLPSDVTILESQGRGASSARNAGIYRASADVICCIDDDAWAEPNWLEALADSFLDEGVVGVGGKILPDYETDTGYQLPSELLWLLGATYAGHWDSPGPISRPIGANMAFRRQVLLEVGGFATEFGPTKAKKNNSNEELVLAMRIRAIHGDTCIVYCPTAVVHHFAPSSRLTWRYHLNRCWVEGKSKAGVRSQGSHETMDHDRGYLFGVLMPSIFVYAWRGLNGSRTDLKHSLRGAFTVIVTAVGYAVGRLGDLL